MRVRCRYTGGIVHRPQLVQDQVYQVHDHRHGCYYIHIDGQIHSYMQYRFVVEPDPPIDFDAYNGVRLSAP